MSVAAILLPVFVQVGLTFVLLFWMRGVRFAALKSGAVKAGDVALAQRAWPARAQQVSNAYSNQFEIPVLFYAVVAFAMITRKADLVFVVLEWLFVVSRIAHALVYGTSNNLRHRFMIFALGAAILIAMWVYFALKTLLPL